MKQVLYITSTSVICNAAVYKNGLEIFCDQEAGDAADFLNHAYKGLQCSYPKFYKMDNLAKLGWLCAEILVNSGSAVGPGETGSKIKAEDPGSVSVLLCNSNSSLDTDFKYYQTVEQMPSPALFVYTLPNIVIGEICIRNGWKGENAFFITPSFDAAFLQEQVQLMLADDNNTCCVCGWVELLGNEYKACLFAVEKQDDGQNIIFTRENIKRVFNHQAEKFLENDINITT